jgi:hypothetical protein
MSRRYPVIAAILACYISGCGGTDQPNAPAVEVNDTFLKSSTDMMKEANTGLAPKKKPASR